VSEDLGNFRRRIIGKRGSCYICDKKERHIDNHHVDCAHGQLSDETVSLCRRCHRTYHDLGIKWFDNEYLDKAIELENRRRKIRHAAYLADPKYVVKPSLCLLERKDIKRSDYWCKVHGIKKKVNGEREIVLAKDLNRYNLCPPLCGQDWYEEHKDDSYPEQAIVVEYDGKVVAKVLSSEKKGTLKRRLKEMVK